MLSMVEMKTVTTAITSNRKALHRGKIDMVLPNMFSNTTYSSDYLFYANMISQCSIKIDNTLPAPAGISFHIDHYNLYINPEKIDS